MAGLGLRAGALAPRLKRPRECDTRSGGARGDAPAGRALSRVRHTAPSCWSRADLSAPLFRAYSAPAARLRSERRGPASDRHVRGPGAMATERGSSPEAAGSKLRVTFAIERQPSLTMISSPHATGGHVNAARESDRGHAVGQGAGRAGARSPAVPCRANGGATPRDPVREGCQDCQQSAHGSAPSFTAPARRHSHCAKKARGARSVRPHPATARRPPSRRPPPPQARCGSARC